jgi:hypothetical protein
MAEHRQPVPLLARLRDSGNTIRGAFAKRKAEIAAWADIRAFPPLAAIVALDCVAGLVLWRKFAGGPPLHLTSTRLCIAGVSVAALTVAGRWWLARIEREPPALWIRTLLMALGSAPMVVLLSLANSQHSPWAVSMTSALAVASGGAVLFWNRLPSADTAPAQSYSPQPVTFPLPTTPAASLCPEAGWASPTASPATLAGTAHPTERAAGADQGTKPDEWMERTLDDVGTAILRGQVFAEFAAGQSVAVLHIPFCPAFALLPEITCDVIGAPAIRARAPAVYRYGARVELKRTGDTSHSTRVAIRFRAGLSEGAARAA